MAGNGPKDWGVKVEELITLHEDFPTVISVDTAYEKVKETSLVLWT